jgi:hypothetical protein
MDNTIKSSGVTTGVRLTVDGDPRILASAELGYRWQNVTVSALAITLSATGKALDGGGSFFPLSLTPLRVTVHPQALEVGPLQPLAALQAPTETYTIKDKGSAGITQLSGEVGFAVPCDGARLSFGVGGAYKVAEWEMIGGKKVQTGASPTWTPRLGVALDFTF